MIPACANSPTSSPITSINEHMSSDPDWLYSSADALGDRALASNFSLRVLLIDEWRSFSPPPVMSNAPASTYLVWSIISIILLSFLLYHLYCFDRFKCLRWNNGPYSGAFKRLMTYTYLFNVPLIATFAVGYTIIKYREGSIVLEGYGSQSLSPIYMCSTEDHLVIPKPFHLWSAGHRSAVLPLNLAFSVAWSMEMVTHLEELCFWLFLVTSQTNPQQNWFRSVYFKTWACGSVVAVIYMPLVTIFTRGNSMKSEAYTFLAGGLGSLSLTLWFTPIL